VSKDAAVKVDGTRPSNWIIHFCANASRGKASKARDWAEIIFLDTVLLFLRNILKGCAINWASRNEKRKKEEGIKSENRSKIEWKEENSKKDR
jgi:hypothetical protein